jgi:hypothetical protein
MPARGRLDGKFLGKAWAFGLGFFAWRADGNGGRPGRDGTRAKPRDGLLEFLKKAIAISFDFD